MPQTMKGNVRQAETPNQATVRSIEAGRREAADVARKMSVPSQLLQQRRRHRYAAGGCAGLRRGVDDLAVVKPHALVGDVDFATLKVNVRPTEAAYLAPSQTQHQTQRQRQAVPMLPERLGIGDNLIVCPGVGRVLDMRRARYTLHGIAWQIPQGTAQHDPAQLCRARVAVGYNGRQHRHDLSMAELVQRHSAD